MFVSCDETLPAHDDPIVLLDGAVYATYTYVDDNQLTLSMSIKNLFDETLQGRAVMQGFIRVTPHSSSAFSRTISLGPEHITEAAEYDPLTRQLTIDPNEEIWLTVSWDFHDDRQRDLRDSLFRYIQDPTCTLRMISYQETFTVESSVVLFDRIGQVIGEPIEISLCYITAHIDGRVCPLIDINLACSYVRDAEQPGVIYAN